MEIIDDLLPQSIFNYIRDCCISKRDSKVPFYISPTNNEDDRLNFSFLIQEPNNPHTEIFMPLVVEVADRLGVNPFSLIRVRIAITPQSKTNDIKASHIDDVVNPHWSAVFYLNNSDGDTIFWKEKDSNEIVNRVTPKENRVVIFDGSQYHSSSSPCQSEFRAVINLNFSK